VFSMVWSLALNTLTEGLIRQVDISHLLA